MAAIAKAISSFTQVFSADFDSLKTVGLFAQPVCLFLSYLHPMVWTLAPASSEVTHVETSNRVCIGSVPRQQPTCRILGSVLNND